MLARLHREIDARTREIAATHGGWPCRAGCDGCCRRLKELPRLTRADWKFLEEGLERLAESTRAGIEQRIAEAREGEERRICPFLDRDAGRCLVYEYRPVACRTYGFYVERDRGLYCGIIEARVDAGEMDGVVWGNAMSVEHALDECGEKIGLLDWFSDSLRSTLQPLPTPPSTTPDPCGEP
jgi:Fe-S-cluster containining protein